MDRITEGECFRINKWHMYFLCPYCEVKNKKTDDCKDHRHGSGGDTDNRVVYRTPHCDNKQCDLFKINITDCTIRS